MSSLKNILQFAVVVLLVTLLIRHIAWGDVWLHITGADVRWLAVYVGLYLLGIVIAAHRWRLIARWGAWHPEMVDQSAHQSNDQGSDQDGEQTDPGLWFYIRTYIIGTFVNNFLPSFVGGDAYRAWARAAHIGSTLAHNAQVIIVDRITGLASILILAALCVSVAATSPESGDLPVGASSFAWVLWAMIGIGFLAVYAPPLVRFLDRVSSGQVSRLQRVARFLGDLLVYRDLRVVVPALGWGTVFALVGVAAANYALFVSLGAMIPPLQYLSVVFVISVIAALPVSMGNVGIKEWAYILLFGLYGVDPAICVAVVLLSRVLQAAVSLAAAPLYLMSEHRVQLRK